MTDILQEIEEDLRRERYARLWRRFGVWIIAAVVLLAAALVGWVWWRSAEANARLAESAAYAAASDAAGAGRRWEAIEAFGSVAVESADGYRALAELRRGALLSDEGRTDDAVAAYDAVRASAPTPGLRDAATLFSGYALLKGARAGEAADRVQPLTAPGNAYRPLAVELQAVAAMAQGQGDRAIGLLEPLIEDVESPAGVRMRASQLLSELRPVRSDGAPPEAVDRQPANAGAQPAPVPAPAPAEPAVPEEETP